MHRLHELTIDVGASKWLAGRWRAGGFEVLARRATRGFQPFLDDLAGLAAHLDRAPGSVGCSFPGAVAHGVVTEWPNRPDWHGAALVAGLRDALGSASVDIHDDGACAVAGEALLGRFSGERDVLVLSLGSGLGGGFFLDGAVRMPMPSDARTIGHVRALPAGRCVCGATGCLQTALQMLPPGGDEGTRWAAGARLAQTCADMCRMLGVGDVVLTGGLMNRASVWDALRIAFEDEGIACWRAPSPDLSAALGAMLAGWAKPDAGPSRSARVWEPSHER